MLHTDPWCTCVNKQSHGWTEMMGVVNIYRCRREIRQSWVRLSLLLGEIWSVTESASEWLGAPLGQRSIERATADLRLSNLRPRSWRSAKLGLEDNTMGYGQEKKKKIWVYMAICLRLHPSSFVSVCLSHTHLQRHWPLSRIKSESFIFITICHFYNYM